MRRLLLATALTSMSTPALAAPSFSIADAVADENSGAITFMIRKHGQLNGQPSSVTFYTVDGTAKAGSDYAAQRLLVPFGATETAKQVSAPLVNDSVPEPAKQFTGKLLKGTNARLYDGTAVGTITDSDVAMRTCPDGAVIPATDACPVPPPPPPADDSASPTLEGLAPIASEFDVKLGLIPVPLPKSAAPDAVGAFRFICMPGQLLYDDPIVYPGQPGKSHLHQFYGHEGADAFSTYASLRGSGASTCARKFPLNRSAYWMPAMLDGTGMVVRPDYVAIYYKRRPKSDPKCSLTSGDLRAEGNCVELPNGLKFIFGYDMVTATPPTGAAYFDCQGTGAISGHYSTISNTVGKCVAGGKIGAVIKAPACWNGKDLDSANHRDHVAFAGYGTWGYLRCPKTHPYVIPGFTLQAWYSILPGDDLSKWKFSSDEMRPELPHGSTFHADFFMAWDPTVKKMWHDNCIDKRLNCSAGDLGNGFMIDGAAVTGVAGGRVPVPANPNMAH